MDLPVRAGRRQGCGSSTGVGDAASGKSLLARRLVLRLDEGERGPGLAAAESVAEQSELCVVSESGTSCLGDSAGAGGATKKQRFQFKLRKRVQRRTREDRTLHL